MGKAAVADAVTDAGFKRRGVHLRNVSRSIFSSAFSSSSCFYLIRKRRASKSIQKFTLLAVHDFASAVFSILLRKRKRGRERCSDMICVCLILIVTDGRNGQRGRMGWKEVHFPSHHVM